MGFIIYHLLLGTHRKSHGQNSGSLKRFWKSSRDSVPPNLQSAVLQESALYSDL